MSDKLDTGGDLELSTRLCMQTQHSYCTVWCVTRYFTKSECK
jgi:hypothetical protein